MTPWRLSAGFAVGLIALFAAPGGGQDAPVFRGEAFVNTVEVPVRVLDRDGQPVTGLTEEDFEILEDGEAQVITNFVEIRGAERRQIVQTPQMRSITIDAAALDTVYFFDLLLSEKEDKRRAVDGVQELYNDGIPPGEHVSIVTFDGEVHPLIERCTSSAELMAVLKIVDKTRAHGLMSRMYFEDDSMIQDRRARRSFTRQQRQRYYAELRQRVDRVAAGLSATLARYADTDSRRAVVVFTTGLPRSNWSAIDGSWDNQVEEPSFLHQGLWYTAAMEASDLGYTLYFVDSSTARYAAETDIDKSPVLGSGSLSGEDGGDTGSDDVTEDEDSAFWFDSTRRGLLSNAAHLTGGDSLHYSDVYRAVQKVSDDLGFYYSMAYQPDHVGDGREHEIEVLLPEHPGYRVQHRMAYVDRPMEEREAHQLRAQMLFKGDANPHGVLLVFGEPSKRFRLDARGMKRVKVDVEIRVPFAAFTLVEQDDGYAGFGRIAFMVEDSEGNTSDVISHQTVILVAEEDLEEAIGHGYFSFTTELETEGGKQTLHVAVTDALNQRTSVLSEKVKF
jgi:VWFA-related protein